MIAPGQSVIQQAIKAEQSGDRARAYLLWAQAAQHNPELWAKAKALAPASSSFAAVSEGPDPSESNLGDILTGTITARDLEEARRYAGPPRLAPSPNLRNYHLKLPVKELYENLAHDFGYVAVLDRDIQNGPNASTPIRFDADNVTYSSALRLAEAATNTFVVPVSDKVFLVATDSVQKRNEYEPTGVQAFPIPQRSSVQEAQELLTAIQQTLEIRRSVIDPFKRMILLRGPHSHLLVAEALFYQLAGYKPQVSIEVELITFSESKSRSWGLGLMNSTNLVNFGQALGHQLFWNGPSTSAITNFLGFGGGATYLGIGLTAAKIFANATESESKSLIRSQTVVTDGQPATFHVGDKYPIVTSQFSGVSPTAGGIQTAIPQFNFEDLGLILKVTPAVHSTGEVSLDVEAEFKSLGSANFNGIPTISTRKLQSKIRLSTEDWAVVGGLINRNEANTISGIAGLSSLPVVGRLFRDTTVSSDISEALILIKPTVIAMPPSERPTKDLFVGSETRWPTVL